MVSVGGLASGLDTNSIITQLLELERRPIQQLEAQVQQLAARQARYVALEPSLNALRSAVGALGNRNVLEQPRITNSNEAIARIAATPEALNGAFDLQVTQLARAGRRASQGLGDADAVGSGPGTFAVRSGPAGAVLSVAVDENTSLRDLANAINAQDGDVAAAVINDGTAENANRLVLTSARTGRENDIQIVTNDTILQFDATVVEAAVADEANGTAYTGTVTSSGTYLGDVSRTIIVEILESGPVGVATYRVSFDGGVTFDDNDGAGFATSAGASDLGLDGQGVQVAFSEGGSLSEGDRFTIDVTAPVLQEAADAVFTLNGILQTRPSNTVDDALEGVTIDLLSADPEAVTDFAIQPDDASIVDRVDAFVEAFNEIVSGIREQQQFDPTTQTGGPLLGDTTANRIISNLRSALNRPAENVTTGVRRLVDLGIETQADGGIALDRSVLEELLASDRDAVLAVLTSSADGSVDALSVSARPNDIAPGSYAVNVVTPPERARVLAPAPISGPLTADETLTFEFNDDASNPDATSSVFTVALQAGDSASRIVDRLNSAFATQGVALEASVVADALAIESDFGSDFFFSVASDRPAGEGTTQLGTTGRSDSGVDIAGTVGGEPATGRGSSLTASGRLDGLVVTYTGSESGRVGAAVLTTGLAEIFESSVDTLVSGSDSVIGLRNAAIQDQIDRLNQRIEAQNERLARTQARLEAEFANLEVTLSQLQAQSTFLTNQLSQFNQGPESGA
ncbi:MAG: flagellar filament capping protein FliD [Myxococcota bacterium]